MDFIEDGHGIYRYIPYKGYMYYEDNGKPVKQYYKLDITDVEVPGYYYEKYYEDNCLVLKIGEADTYVRGPMSYQISYFVTAGEDGVEHLTSSIVGCCRRTGTLHRYGQFYDYHARSGDE